LIESDDSFSLDFIGFDRDRHDAGRVALLAGEAKARGRLIDQLIEETTSCAGMTPECHRGWPKIATAHRKCVALLRMVSEVDRLYLWTVAPGVRRSFWATAHDGRLLLEGVEAEPERLLF
jgi:hypothetical protein